MNIKIELMRTFLSISIFQNDYSVSDIFYTFPYCVHPEQFPVSKFHLNPHKNPQSNWRL